MCVGECELTCKVSALVQARGISESILQCVDGHMRSDDLMADPWWRSHPPPKRSLATFLREDRFPISTLVAFVGRFGAFTDFTISLVDGLSDLVEKMVMLRVSEGASGGCMPQGELLGHRRDPAVRRRMRQLLYDRNIGKNYANLGRLAKSMGIKGHTLASDSHNDVFRYWLASRRLLACDVHVALAADAGRFGGRERLAATCILGLDSGLACWAAPQDRVGAHWRPVLEV